MSFAVVLEGMSVVAYLIILGGGKRLRENGWRVLSLLIILSAIVQAAGMSIVVGSFQGQTVARWQDCIVSILTGIFCRHICSTTRTGSSLAGVWISPGFSVLSVGALV
jgi:hypothetical protein